MSVRVLRNRLGPPGGRDPFANRFALEVERQLIEQVFVVPIGGQVHAVPKQLAQAVIAQVVGHQHRPAGDSLEDPHVDVVANAPVERDACRRIGPRHVVEVALANERVAISPLDEREQIAARAGKDIAHERDVVLLGHVMLAVNIRVTGQGKPRGGSHADPPKQLDPIALRGEHNVEARGLLPAPVEIEVRVNRPESAGSQLARQVIPQAVVDIQVEVEALAGHAFQVSRLEVLDLNESLEGTVTINARRLGPEDAVENEGDAMNGHGKFPVATAGLRVQR